MRLSVIIPVFGAERYIARCLDSVLSINLPESEYEVICIDDCSEDASLNIINEYGTLHNNLHITRHAVNKRQGGARNTGIKLAKGKYMMFVDADDCIPAYDVSGLLDYMDKNGIELLLGAANVLKQDGRVTRWGNSPNEESKIMTGPEIFIGGYIHKVAFGVVWMGIYKTDLVRSIPPFHENIQFEDTDWTMCCAYNANRLQYKPVVIYNYMENEGSTTAVYSINKLRERVKQGLRIWKWAQTTTQYHDDVLAAAEDYCTWNLQCLSSLNYFSYSDRKLFFQSFTDEDFTIMKQWKLGGKWMRFIRNPFSSRFELLITSPIYRFAHSVKGAFKQ